MKNLLSIGIFVLVIAAVCYIVLSLIDNNRKEQFEMSGKDTDVSTSCQLQPNKELDIVIYSTPTCSFCVNAKQLLSSKGLKYTEKNIAESSALLKEMLTKSGGMKSVPQIFINNKHIGGFSDLEKWEKNGELDKAINSCK